MKIAYFVCKLMHLKCGYHRFLGPPGGPNLGDSPVMDSSISRESRIIRITQMQASVYLIIIALLGILKKLSTLNAWSGFHEFYYVFFQITFSEKKKEFVI